MYFYLTLHRIISENVLAVNPKIEKIKIQSNMKKDHDLSIINRKNCKGNRSTRQTLFIQRKALRCFSRDGLWIYIL